MKLLGRNALVGWLSCSIARQRIAAVDLVVAPYKHIHKSARSARTRVGCHSYLDPIQLDADKIWALDQALVEIKVGARPIDDRCVAHIEDQFGIRRSTHACK